MLQTPPLFSLSPFDLQGHFPVCSASCLLSTSLHWHEAFRSSLCLDKQHCPLLSEALPVLPGSPSSLFFGGGLTVQGSHVCCLSFPGRLADSADRVMGHIWLPSVSVTLPSGWSGAHPANLLPPSSPADCPFCSWHRSVSCAMFWSHPRFSLDFLHQVELFPPIQHLADPALL